MGMFGEKRPAFIDLDMGKIGTFIKIDESPSEKGFVFPTFVPLNSIRQRTYGKAVKLDSIHTVRSPYSENGVERDIVIVFEGRDDSLMRFVRDENARKVVELREKIKDLEIALATAKQQSEDAVAGASRTVAKLREIGKTKEDQPKNPFADPNDIFGENDNY